MENNETPEKQVFNMSLSILERVDSLIDCCIHSSLKKDFPKWFDYLKVLVFKRKRNQNKQMRSFIIILKI